MPHRKNILDRRRKAMNQHATVLLFLIVAAATPAWADGKGLMDCSAANEPETQDEAIKGTELAAGSGTLCVDGEKVRIVRDDFGVPHIFAETNRGRFVGYGYALAADRLWQLELNRRSASGRLAEVMGPSSVNADRNARTLGYTDAELAAQFAQMSAEEQQIFNDFAAGITRYIMEVVAPN